MNLKLINEQLNLPDIELITKSGEHLIQLPEESEIDPIEYDYNKSRTNIHSLLSQGQDALNYALEVAKQSENARAFEVVGNMIKQLAEINTQLLDVSEKKQRLTTKKPEVQQVTNNNAIFVGSTNELSKMIKQLNPIN